MTQDPQASATYYTDLLSALALSPNVISAYREHLSENIMLLENHKVIVKYLLKLFDQAKTPPSKDMLKRAILSNGASNKDELVFLIDRVYGADLGHVKIFAKDLHHHLERISYETSAAMYVQLVKDGKYKQAMDVVRKAPVSASTDQGGNYFDAAAVERRLDEATAVYDRHGHVPTGIRSIDKSLYGGPAAGEVYYVIADTGEGKTRFKLNLAANAARFGKKVFIASLELKKEICYGRLDQIFTGLPAESIKTELGRERLKIQMEAVHDAGGFIYVHKWKENSCTITDLVTQITRQSDKLGVKFDLILIDYIDKMRFDGTKGNYWLDQTAHYDNLRGELAYELDCVVWSSTQKNKNGDYFGAQGKQAAVDGAYMVHMSAEDDRLRRFWLTEDKMRYNASKPQGIKLIVRPDGMSVSEVDDWPDGYKDPASK